MWLSWAAFENQFRIGTLWCRWRLPSSGASNTKNEMTEMTTEHELFMMTFDALANGSWPTCHWKLQWYDSDMISWKWVLDSWQLLVQINTSSYRYTDLPAEKRERETLTKGQGRKWVVTCLLKCYESMHCLYEWCGRADGWHVCDDMRVTTWFNDIATE